MIATIKKHKHNIVGITGMLILQANSIPLIYQSVLLHQSVNILTPIMCMCGLACYLYYSVVRRDVLYTVSNSIGLTLNMILLLANI